MTLNFNKQIGISTACLYELQVNRGYVYGYGTTDICRKYGSISWRWRIGFRVKIRPHDGALMQFNVVSGNTLSDCKTKEFLWDGTGSCHCWIVEHQLLQHAYPSVITKKAARLGGFEARVIYTH